MARRRPLTPQQLAEIEEAAKRGPDGKPLHEAMRGMIQGTATASEPDSTRPPDPPRSPVEYRRARPLSCGSQQRNTAPLGSDRARLARKGEANAIASDIRFAIQRVKVPPERA